MEQTPAYSTYSLAALRDCAERIDKEKYPDRYQEILRLLNDPTHLAEQRLEQQLSAASLKYSTFWPRVGAVVCDGIFLLLCFTSSACYWALNIRCKISFYKPAMQCRWPFIPSLCMAVMVRL